MNQRIDILKRFNVLLLLFALTSCASSASQKEDPVTEMNPSEGPLRVLVVTGGHDYETSFYTVFEGNSGFVWDHAVSNKIAFKSDIREKYDVLVLYDMTSDLDEAGKKNLKDFVESGKGIVVLHHAILDYDDWPWWYETVVGGRYLNEPQGGMPASTYEHDQNIKIRPVGKHPVTVGVEEVEILDETYKGMWISPDVQVILETENPTSDGPVAWISPYDRSRVIYIQLGHGSPSHRHPAFRRLVHNAVFWAAGR